MAYFGSETMIVWSWARARNTPPAIACPFMAQTVGIPNVRRRLSRSWNRVRDSAMLVPGFYYQNLRLKPLLKTFGPEPMVTTTPGPSVVCSILSNA